MVVVFLALNAAVNHFDPGLIHVGSRAMKLDLDDHDEVVALHQRGPGAGYFPSSRRQLTPRKKGIMALAPSAAFWNSTRGGSKSRTSMLLPAGMSPPSLVTTRK